MGRLSSQTDLRALCVPFVLNPVGDGSVLIRDLLNRLRLFLLSCFPLNLHFSILMLTFQSLAILFAPRKTLYSDICLKRTDLQLHVSKRDSKVYITLETGCELSENNEVFV